MVVQASVALSDPSLSRAVSRLAEVLLGVTWLSALKVRASGGDVQPVEVLVGETPAVESAGPRRLVQFTEEVDGISVLACASIKDKDGYDRDGQEAAMLRGVSRMLASRVAAHKRMQAPEEDRLAEAMSVLSHDLRTPLTCIKGYLTLLGEGKRPPGSPEWDEYYPLVLQECDRLERLISTVLDNGAGERNLRLHCEPVLVPELLSHVLVEEHFVGRGHRLAVDIRPDARIAWADPVRLDQVLRNLVDNAVKYSPGGSLVMVRVRREREKIQFSVADQGNGIAREHLNRLFERFYRVRDKSLGDVHGTGLGLSIARRIVEAHGGEIWAESSPGKGATFYFTLPTGPMDDLQREECR